MSFGDGVLYVAYPHSTLLEKGQENPPERDSVGRVVSSLQREGSVCGPAIKTPFFKDPGDDCSDSPSTPLLGRQEQLE